MDQEVIKQEIATLLERMGFSETVEAIETHQGVTSRFSVRLAQDAPMLIGERGSTLVALEHLVKRILKRKYGEDPKFTIDVNEYRMRRLEDLKQDVKAAAKEVRMYRRDVPLRPMSGFERRIVHLLLAEYPDITTESVGEEPSRRVVIKPYP